jgi:hypothetical protein
VTTSKFLDIEVSLLLSKYGKQAVVSAMARKLDLTPAEIDALLANVERLPEPRNFSRPDRADTIRSLIEAYPEKSEELRTLQEAFMNRAFLPELRDVRRFFEQHSGNLGHPKSRAESLLKVMRLLAEIDKEELVALVAVSQARPSKGYSSLGIIAEEILRGNR